MDYLPIEILLKIGTIDQSVYIAMLAIPKFARALTIGFRLDTMTQFGFIINRIRDPRYVWRNQSLRMQIDAQPYVCYFTDHGYIETEQMFATNRGYRMWSTFLFPLPHRIGTYGDD